MKRFARLLLSERIHLDQRKRPNSEADLVIIDQTETLATSL